METYNRFVYTEDNLPIASSKTNDELECKNCRFVDNSKTIECEKYFLKPDCVLNNTGTCPKFSQA